MIAGVATDTIVVSTRIMKKPRQSANRAGHGSFSSTAGAAGEVWVMTQPNTRPGTMHSVTPDPHADLMAGPPPTHLPVDPAQAEIDAGTAPVDVVRRHPASPAAWAALAAAEIAADGDSVTVYAYSRVGYHRSLDLLRRNGWKGHGPVPWEHEPNRGFLSCLGLLALAARAIGETDEYERCRDFLRDSSPAAYDVLFAGVE
jgi:hypothetical protein